MTLNISQDLIKAKKQIEAMIRITDERRIGFRDKKAFVDAAACAIRIRALQDAIKAIEGQ